MRSPASPDGEDGGSAIVETVLVMVLLLSMALGLIHLVTIAHVRSVLAAVAAEGARQGSRSGATAADGAAYAQRAAEDSLGLLTTCTAHRDRHRDTGLATLVVRCTAAIDHLTVSGTGRALVETS
jgi:Flp pilus assembly protein TadG